MRGIDLRTIGSPAFLIDVENGERFRIAGFSASLAALVGVSADAVSGRTPYECFGCAYAELVEPRYRHLVATARPYEYEEQLEHSGVSKWWRTTLTPIVDPASGRIVQILGMPVDITARKKAELAIEREAQLDPLTGVANRRSFDRHLARSIDAATVVGRCFSVVVVDVDRFKAVNDTHGHPAGDAVLQAFAERIRRSVGVADHVARIGGDEFAAVLAADTPEALAATLGRLERQLVEPVEAKGVSMAVGASLGAALWAPGVDRADLLSRADAAMYSMKARRAAA